MKRAVAIWPAESQDSSTLREKALCALQTYLHLTRDERHHLRPATPTLAAATLATTAIATAILATPNVATASYAAVH